MSRHQRRPGVWKLCSHSAVTGSARHFIEDGGILADVDSGGVSEGGPGGDPTPQATAKGLAGQQVQVCVCV